MYLILSKLYYVYDFMLSNLKIELFNGKEGSC